MPPRDAYTIVRVLGRGSFGTTYEAVDARAGNKVALKVLSLGNLADWKAFELFQREARALARLDHASIPRFIEAFDTEGERGEKEYAIVQELAPGRSLEALVEAGWRASEAEARQIAAQALKVLSYIHARKIVHRDIKPSNVIRDESGRIRIVDFGGAREILAGTARGGSTMIGTYGYMAPEQFRGKALPASDLYALGATLVTVLTGRSPAELPQRRLRVDLRSEPRIPRALRPWLDRMLAPAVEDRFASARAAFDALERPRRARLEHRTLAAFAAGFALCGVLAVAAHADEPPPPPVAPVAVHHAPIELDVPDKALAPAPVPPPAFAVLPSLPGQPRTTIYVHPGGVPAAAYDVTPEPQPSRIYLQIDNAELEEIVESVYESELHRPSDPAGMAYWISHTARPLAMGHHSREEIRAALVRHFRDGYKLR